MTDSFDQYMFTSNATNLVCPAWLFGGYTWKCPPPNACATDPSTTKEYCCQASGICWTASSVCAGDGSTFTCSSGGYSWCCLKNKEICTQLAGQINICYSTTHDTLSNISSSVLDETYSSLSSAQPSASSYTFDPLKLIAQTQTTSTQTATTTNSAVPSNPSNSSNSSPSPSPSPIPSPNPLPGGAIAGIVVGAVAAIAIVGIAAFLVRRSKRKQKGPNQMTTSHSEPKDTRPAQEYQKGYQKDYGHMAHEMQADTTQVVELPGAHQYHLPQELPTKRY